MDPYPHPKLLQEMSTWITATGFPKRMQISWTPTQLEAVMNYFSKFEVESAFSLRMHQKLCLHQEWPNRFRCYRKFAKIVVSFFQLELGEVFQVPKFDQLSLDKPLRRNEIAADFISFLLQLLHPNPHYYASSRFPFVKDLRFLVSILGDAPFQVAENGQLRILLDEFEQVANEAGGLVHSLVFSPDSLMGERDEALNTLSRHIQSLNGNIGNFLNSLLNIDVTSQSNSVDSLFIINSVLLDLKKLISRHDEADSIKDQAKTIHEELENLQSLLYDTNTSQQLEIVELKVSMMKIKDMAYEADYLINSYTAGDTPIWYLSGRLTHLIRQIKLIGEKLQSAKNCYDLETLKAIGAPPPIESKKDLAVDENIVHIDKEIDILAELTRGTQELKIISISGMAGLGKTTLAKKLFHNPLIHYHFYKSSWCVVPQVYQRKSLLCSILIDLSDLEKAFIMHMDDYDLTREIYRSLKGQRYLIVVDNMWWPNVWDDIRIFFPNDKKGSRVLFTSRDDSVCPEGSIIHRLPMWSNGQCWELLKRKIFGNAPCPPELEEVGQKIGANCHQLPLAVVVVAGLLSTMAIDKITWEKFGESLPHIFPGRSDMAPILELSYKRLPQELKPCFLYFGAFPQNEQISVKRLIQLWIAEGFIHTEKNKTTKSEVAQRYLMKLISKSLVMVAKTGANGGVKACTVHGLLRDMCLKIAQEENFLKVADHNSLIWNQKFQRMRIRANPSCQPSSGYLVPYGPCTRSIFGSMPEISMILHNMKLLRVLSCKTRFYGIELLVHLRYLVVDDMLPSIAFLENLEVLIVNSESVYITSDLLSMAKLRYLCFKRTSFAKDCNVSENNNLEFLSHVSISNPNHLELLKYSPHLLRLKCEYRPSWGEHGEYTCLDLEFLRQLQSLTIRAELLNSSIVDIKFPKRIRKLSLSAFHLSWSKISMIGALPYLEVLKLGMDAFEGKTWVTNDDEFMQLKFLKLRDLKLSTWNVEDHKHFPMLQHLVIEDCSNLTGIPCEIGDIATLQSIELHGICRKLLVESATQIQQQQQDEGNELAVNMRDIEIESDGDDDMILSDE